jgi:hypothetical protein
MTFRADTKLVVLHARYERAVAIALIAWAIAGCSSSAAQAPNTTEAGGSSATAAGGSTASQTGGVSGLGGSAPANGGSLATSGGADGTAGLSAGSSLGGANGVAGNDSQAGGAAGLSGSGGAAERGASGGAAAGVAGHGGSGGAAAVGGTGAFAGATAGGASNRPLKAVMVVQGAGTPTAGDKVMVSRMTARGITTSFFSDSAVTAAAVANMDLVVISSSAESGPLGTKMRDISIPVLCIENGEYPLMAMTGATLNTDYGQLTGVSQILIASESPLVGALSGTITISSTASDFGWGIPGAAALKGATVLSNANHFAIFGYEKGAQMVGLVAPARRAAFAIRETVAANLTSDGKLLFDTVLNWVLM